nr:unnamed protein product [Spirometra erinaceieuropaei]
MFPRRGDAVCTSRRCELRHLAAWAERVITRRQIDVSVDRVGVRHPRLQQLSPCLVAGSRQYPRVGEVELMPFLEREVSKEQEEEEEQKYFENEDVEEEEYEEDQDEAEKMPHDGLSDETKEEKGKAEEVGKKEELEKREREVADSEEQGEVGRMVVEKKDGVELEKMEDTRQNVDEKVKRDEEANEMTKSKQDAMHYCQLFSEVLDASERKMKTEGTLLNTAAKLEGYGATSTSEDDLQQLTRAEKWAMKRHVGQWRNACASAESNNLLDHRRRRSTVQRLRHVWRRFVCCGVPHVEG